MRFLPLALCLLSLAPSAQDPPAQERLDDETRAAIEKLLEQSISARAVIRPQAARRLAGYGAPAAEAVLARAGEGTTGLAALGADLVEALGEFGDERLRTRMWEGLADLDFPWRPAAARGLAATAVAEEGERFEALLSDHLGTARVAAVRGLAALGREESEPLVSKALKDPDGRVRRAAADALLGVFGRDGAFLHLVAELLREDRFFERDTGKEARFEAAAMLRRRFPEMPELRSDLLPGDPANAQAFQFLETAANSLLGEAQSSPPYWTAPGRVEGEVVLGLELRSCRKGEIYLRVTADDALWVGLGDAARVALEPGTAAQLAGELRAAVAPLGEERFWGRFGCDLERLFVPDAEGGFETYMVQKGPEAGERLRPEALGRAAAQLLAGLDAVPAESEDARVADLHARLADALAAVGGPLPAD